MLRSQPQRGLLSFRDMEMHFRTLVPMRHQTMIDPPYMRLPTCPCLLLRRFLSFLREFKMSERTLPF